jgi:hypothetical protein
MLTNVDMGTTGMWVIRARYAFDKPKGKTDEQANN